MTWGSMTVEKIDENGKVVDGEDVRYRDAKVWPGGSCTSHWNGITKEDVSELTDKGAEYIVLSRGQWAFLHVPPAIVEELEKLGLKVIVERSSVAMETYNKLIDEGRRVAGLFHTTC
ncbi:unnamed protein product [Mesocestoides corti]|uniref:Mth938 domain-containing protein n=1 Tax=Mesocestoides corti TaxID=53468 RepID=A0A0R3URG0_MESCO|nr:unnamed protein product [Mesocestoides corti]